MIMTREEKELIFRDLCGRVPYGVKCSIDRYKKKEVVSVNNDGIDGIGGYVAFKFPLKEPDKWGNTYVTEEYSIYEYNIKPYLRPLSSMTEEEYDEMFGQFKLAQMDFFKKCSTLYTSIDKLFANDFVKYDWLNKHHFNYRLPDHLFNVVTEKNNPYKI